MFSYSFLLLFFFPVYFFKNFNIHFISFCLIGNNMRYWGLSFPFSFCFSFCYSVAISYFSDYCKQRRENWRKLKSITILMAFIFVFYFSLCSASKPLQFWQADYWSYSHLRSYVLAHLAHLARYLPPKMIQENMQSKTNQGDKNSYIYSNFFQRSVAGGMGTIPVHLMLPCFSVATGPRFKDKLRSYAGKWVNTDSHQLWWDFP